jgi:hypothetical protein
MAILQARVSVPDPSPAMSWVGIPDPETDLGYDALGAVEPADPGNWPGDEETGYYYIDSGHGSATDSNTYGWPDTPRNTIPTSLTIDGGKKIVIVGDGESYTGGTITVSASGASDTAGDQAWVVGRSATDIEVLANRPILSARRIMLNSTYMILDGIKVSHQDTGNPMIGMSQYNTIRNFEIEGTGVDISSGNGSGIWYHLHTVVYNGYVHALGSEDTTNSNDYHAMKPGDGSQYTWTLNCTAFECQGDGIQIGDANGTASNTHHHYVGGSTYYDNKENGVDVKDAVDVIVSGCDVHTMGFNASGDSGPGIVLHDDADWVWIIGTKLHNCNVAFINSGGSNNTFILDSLVYDNNQTGGTGGPTQRTGTGISFQAGECAIHNTTFHNNRKSLEFVVGSDGANTYISNNIFSDRQTTEATTNWDIGFSNSGDEAAAYSDYNMFDGTIGMRGMDSDNSYQDSLSAWQSATTHDDNSSEDDPLFTSEGADDFTLGSGSPALAASDPTKPAAYATFFSRYGIDIEKDLDGNDRPASGTDWDLGCYQRI